MLSEPVTIERDGHVLLIGVNRSPYTRRVAITLEVYGVPYQQQALSGFGNRAEVRAKNPLGRIRRWCSTTARCLWTAAPSSTISTKPTAVTGR